jgi:hypothetical protein
MRLGTRVFFEKQQQTPFVALWNYLGRPGGAVEGSGNFLDWTGFLCPSLEIGFSLTSFQANTWQRYNQPRPVRRVWRRNCPQPDRNAMS